MVRNNIVIITDNIFCIKTQVIALLVVMTSILSAFASNDSLESEDDKPTKGLILEAGPVWTTSGLYYDNSGAFMSERLGIAYNLSYNHLWPNGFGLGIDAFSTKTITGFWIQNYHYQHSYAVSYLGPKFIYSHHFVKRWSCDISIGSGISYLSRSGYGWGFRSSVGIEYMFMNHTSVGISVFDMYSSFYKESKYYMPINIDSGVNQLGVALGLRFYW